MGIRNRFSQQREAIAERWLKAAFETYAPDMASFLRREKDPFANPVGNALRVGTRAIVEGLAEGLDPEKACRALDEVMKMRVLQDFTPARAVGFVFLLKEAFRSVLGKEALEPGHAGDVAAIDAEIDRIALFAFDLYVRWRDRVHELRIGELKRSLGAYRDRPAGRGGAPAAGADAGTPSLP